MIGLYYIVECDINPNKDGTERLRIRTRKNKAAALTLFFSPTSPTTKAKGVFYGGDVAQDRTTHLYYGAPDLIPSILEAIAVKEKS